MIAVDTKNVNAPRGFCLNNIAECFFQKSLAFFERFCYNNMALTNGPLVKRLRRRPLTAKAWVRFPYGSPARSTLFRVCFFFAPVTRTRNLTQRGVAFYITLYSPVPRYGFVSAPQSGVRQHRRRQGARYSPQAKFPFGTPWWVPLFLSPVMNRPYNKNLNILMGHLGFSICIVFLLPFGWLSAGAPPYFSLQFSRVF